MKLERSRNLYELLDEQLRPDGEIQNPFLESVATNYMLGVIYAEVEDAVREALASSASGVADRRVRAFVRSSVGKVVRSIKISEISGTLAAFSPACKAHFGELVGTSGAHATFDQIVGNRHLHAHGGGSDMSWDDVGRGIDQCASIVAAISPSLACGCHSED